MGVYMGKRGKGGEGGNEQVSDGNGGQADSFHAAVCVG